MGSLASRPSPPPPTQIITTPAPAPAPVPAPVAEPQVSPEDEAREVRRTSLLQRDRSRFGTVLTGFRGLLTGSNTAQRKTLLGE